MTSDPSSTGTVTGNRGFAPLRDLPAVIWLLAVVLVSFAHPFLPAPRWLLIHLLLLGAASHSIVVWSQHFADALLHTAPQGTDRARQSRRLLVLNAGVGVVVAGVLTGRWQLTAVGATLVAAAVGWHGAALLRQLRRALPARFSATVRYYVTAAALLPLGAVLGAVMARGLGDPRHDRVMVAHAVVNLLGWVGLSVVGTLVTLWPTMLRTRIAPGAERAAQRALPVLLAAIVVAAGGALLGARLAVPAGLAGYLAGLGVVAAPFLTAARQKRPAGFPTWSVAAGVGWLVVALAALAVMVATAADWAAVGDRLDWAAVPLAAGFAAQVLLGALSYLVPVALGGGPSAARAANTVLDRGGALRIALVNAGLAVGVLPVPSLVRVLCSVLVLAAFAAFLPLLILAIRASRQARTVTGPAAPGKRRGPAPVAGKRPAGQVSGLTVTGLAAVMLAVAAGVAVDPAALGGVGSTAAAAAGAAPTGQTTDVTVTAAGMRFSPSAVDVPAGNRLVITLKNTDPRNVHDLVVDSGNDSGRLAPGKSARLDVGVVGRDLSGWCSVLGHRQLGMVFAVKVTGGRAAAAGPAAPSPMTGHGAGAAGRAEDGTAAADLDFGAEPGAGFRAADAALPPVYPPGRVHRRTFTVREVQRPVAPGVTQQLWTFNGTAPGPVLRGRPGDVFDITLVNDGTIGHSIDFHAGSLAPDQPMRTIPPGASLRYRFTATRAGVWMYHCSTMPMSAHIANGLFGAVVIEPPDLPTVDRSYVLVQSELYLGPQGQPVDMTKVPAERPDAVVFNGYANQYDARPLPAKVGERVRIWVLDAGPNRATSFHVVGGQFDTVYAEGAYLLRPPAGGAPAGGAQSLGLQAAQGGFVELEFPEAGHYPFVSHRMIDAERGAHGLFAVTR